LGVVELIGRFFIYSFITASIVSGRLGKEVVGVLAK